MQHVTPYVLIIVSAAEASLQQSVMRTMYPDVQVAWYYLPRTCWRYLSIVFSCVIHNVI